MLQRLHVALEALDVPGVIQCSPELPQFEAETAQRQNESRAAEQALTAGAARTKRPGFGEALFQLGRGDAEILAGKAQEGARLVVAAVMLVGAAAAAGVAAAVSLGNREKRG